MLHLTSSEAVLVKQFDQNNALLFNVQHSIQTVFDVESKQNQPVMKGEKLKGVDCRIGTQSTVISNETLFVTALSSKNLGI